MIRSDLYWWTCMIGGALIVFALLFCTGCATRAGWVNADGSSGYWAGNVGVNEEEVAHGPSGYSAAKTDGQQSFRDLRIAAQTYTIGQNVVDLGRTAGSVIRAKEVTGREGIRADRDVSLGQQAADAQKTVILNPAPE